MQSLLQRDSQLENYIHFFKRKWGSRRPFVKLFQTQFANYIYDPGTNKLFRCGDAVYLTMATFQDMGVEPAIHHLLTALESDSLMAALQDLANSIEKEHIALLDPTTIYFDSLHFSDLENQVTQHLGQLILEVTEECNLRCAYCVYNNIVTDARNHGTKRMELSTAYKAIDYMAAHSIKQDSPAVTFYGGEPLLRFPFIEKCVDYTHNVFRERHVTFAVTTNGTTITSDIAKFLAREKFGVTVSVDGPQDIHDGYRVFKTGNGTFEVVMRGLEALVKAYGDTAVGLINLSMVYTPPFSSKHLDRVASLWSEFPWMGNITATITYPHNGSIPREKWLGNYSFKEDKRLDEWARDLYLASYLQQTPVHPLVKSIIDASLLKIFARPIFDAPVQSIHLNGCCIPGARKIHIATDGCISLCERVHKSPPCVGHIDSGINHGLLKKVFVEEYSQKSRIRCAHCWANRLCGICYVDAFTEGKYDDRRKAAVCSGVVKTVEEQLKLYSRLLFTNPEGLNYLADIVGK